MNLVLSIVIPILESLGTRIQYDVGIPPIYFAIGIVVILIVGVVIVVLIVAAVRFLRSLRNNKDKHD
jgi:heme/copper-type cytochrome/quinol oxidase subunit 2